MNIHKIATTYVDGPSLREALWVRGCSIGCPGCQNRPLWERGDLDIDPVILGIMLACRGMPITITGGEPFDQARDLARLVRTIRQYAPETEIIVYSGYTLDALIQRSGQNPDILTVLSEIDILVDGPFDRGQDDDWLQFRGSRNQRVIDMRAAMRTPIRDLLSGRAPLLDWDTPEITITADGDIVGSLGLIKSLPEELGATTVNRMCGQVAGL